MRLAWVEYWIVDFLDRLRTFSRDSQSTVPHQYHHLRRSPFIVCAFLRVTLTCVTTSFLEDVSLVECQSQNRITDACRHPFRQAAVRLLTTRSVSITTRSRNITTFASLPSRQPRFPAPIQFQRRWASGEAEAKKEEEVPISELQPTPQEEVENAIHEDHAATESAGAIDAVAESQSATEPQIAESANLTEATDDATTTAAESEPVRRSVDQMPSARDAAATLTEGITGTGTMDARRPFREPPAPKPTVYVGNLFFDVTENDLTKEFQRFGEIKQTRLIRDARGLSKGSVQIYTALQQYS